VVGREVFFGLAKEAGLWKRQYSEKWRSEGDLIIGDRPQLDRSLTAP